MLISKEIEKVWLKVDSEGPWDHTSDPMKVGHLRDLKNLTVLHVSGGYTLR